MNGSINVKQADVVLVTYPLNFRDNYSMTDMLSDFHYVRILMSIHAQATDRLLVRRQTIPNWTGNDLCHFQYRRKQGLTLRMLRIHLRFVLNTTLPPRLASILGAAYGRLHDEWRYPPSFPIPDWPWRSLAGQRFRLSWTKIGTRFRPPCRSNPSTTDPTSSLSYLLLARMAHPGSRQPNPHHSQPYRRTSSNSKQEVRHNCHSRSHRRCDHC